MTGLDLSGLTVYPSQVWGGIRLVPLVRDQPVTELRLHARLFGGAGTVAVQVEPRTAYVSYIPHGFVATWTKDGSPAAAYGTHLRHGTGGTGDGSSAPECVPLRFHRRMARRVAKDQLRFLPQHLALDGYLALHFGGPTVVWEEWSQRAVRRGLSPRVEQAYMGADVAGLQDALRVFEIHPGQCGVLLYAADALAAAFVVPHPDDYRALHPSLVQHMYGELIHHYAMLSGPVPDYTARIEERGVRSIADLRARAAEQQRAWAEFHDGVMAPGLLDTSYDVQRVYRMGRFTLSRFLPPFQRRSEQHIGETITDERGRIVYLNTFRLSETQVRRGHLLVRLAAHDWSLPATAADLRIEPAELARRLEDTGFGALLRQDVRDHYRARRVQRAAGYP